MDTSLQPHSPRGSLFGSPDVSSVAVGVGVAWFGACAMLLILAFALVFVRVVALVVVLAARRLAFVLSVFFWSPFCFFFAVFWPASAQSSAEVAPGVPAWVQTDDAGQVVGLEDDVVEFRQVPITAHLCARPRRRAVWVRRLESVLGVAPGMVGRFVRGRWTPDLPAPEFSGPVNLVLSHFEEGVKILGGGSVLARRRGDDEPSREAYVVVEFSDGSRDVVFPELFSMLSSYALLRERNAVLVSALRLRALEWCKSRGFSKSQTLSAVPGSFRFAWLVSLPEGRLREVLAGGPESTLWWSSA